MEQLAGGGAMGPLTGPLMPQLRMLGVIRIKFLAG
jgi:hypothetical protein